MKVSSMRGLPALWSITSVFRICCANSSWNAANRSRSGSISVEIRRRRDGVGDTSISISACLLNCSENGATAVTAIRSTRFAAKSLLLLRHDRCNPHARWRFAEAPPEHAIEMRDVAKAGRKGNIDDRQMQAAAVGQHGEGALKPAFHKMLCERLSRLLEQLLDVSPRQAERADDVVEIEVGIAEAPRDLRQDRPQPGSLHATLRNDLCGFGGRPERCGHQIEEVNADNRG